MVGYEGPFPTMGGHKTSSNFFNHKLFIFFLCYATGDFPSTNGLIAPGMCFPVTVKFSPQTLEDYNDKLEVGLIC